MSGSLEDDLGTANIKVIRVSASPSDIERIEYPFDGDRKAFIECLRAVGMTAVLLDKSVLPEDFYMYDPSEEADGEVLDDDDELDFDEDLDVEIGPVDLRETSPELRRYESYVGKTYEHVVSAPLGPILLTYREEEDWTERYEVAMDRARDGAAESVKAKMRQQHEDAKERHSKIETELQRLYGSPEFFDLLRSAPSKVPLQSLVIAARKRSNVLEGMPDRRLRRLIKEQRDRAKLG